MVGMTWQHLGLHARRKTNAAVAYETVELRQQCLLDHCNLTWFALIALFLLAAPKLVEARILRVHAV